MKQKLLFLLLISVILLTACGQTKLEEQITLLDQSENEVTFPTEKPALFFFITTYT
ncbi:hypothetical protein [Bacillus dakarensis]|uniref:hypothetical protein n=1 Tax=Robertmurraya dakarensis TaxID=1926278 RepID=UPI00192A315E|nr:hypothetical protein [Bacillus dakarensis]